MAQPTFEKARKWKAKLRMALTGPALDKSEQVC